MAERRFVEPRGQESFLILDSGGELVGFGLDGEPKKPAIIVKEFQMGETGLQVHGIVYPEDPEYPEVVKTLLEEPRPLEEDDEESSGISSDRLWKETLEEIESRDGQLPKRVNSF